MKAFMCVMLLVINQVISLPTDNHNDNFVTARNLNDQLKNYLENDLREMMRNKEPILDPYKSDEQIVEYDDEKLSFNGKFNDFIVEQLSYYVVKRSNVNIFLKKVDIEFHFPTIISDGLYDIQARYQNIPLKGNGHFNVTVKDFTLSVEARIKILGTIQLKSLKLKIGVGSIEFASTNQQFDNEKESKEWNEKISKLLETIIVDDSITGDLAAGIMAGVNEWLQNDLLKISQHE
ncbi:uncharacterized protein LOC130671284 [Microplitis mediator]|uniref:uncharacterized protein LOC130671284 n=1 Tax=Microplitis mediator TaxID=375433 RepID=UPI002554E94F|nr:uncharacterized protein LOC130671284 [Microplitis mediator]